MITSRQLSRALIESVLSNPETAEIILEKFEKFLEKNHLQKLLPNIVKSLEDELKRMDERGSLHITTSHKTSKETISTIENFVKKTSRDKTLIKEDEELIGGFVARYNGLIYDGSVKNHLKQLEAILNN